LGQRVTATPNPISGGPVKPAEPHSSQTRSSPPKTETALLDAPESSAQAQEAGGMRLWMHRISVFLFVLISAVAGVLLIILPWTPEWTDNYLLLSYPGLRTWVANGFFRGICSGLGLLDVWIGFWEALHYHEHK
jgi:hypothetical protein